MVLCTVEVTKVCSVVHRGGGGGVCCGGAACVRRLGVVFPSIRADWTESGPRHASHPNWCVPPDSYRFRQNVNPCFRLLSLSFKPL